MRKIVLPAAAALALSAPAMADNFSYNIIELGIVGTTVDDQSGDLDTEGGGLSLDASVELTPNLFGFLELSSVTHELKLYDEEFDIGRGALGLGFNFPLAPGLDLVATGSLQRLRMDIEDVDAFSGYGYGLGLGLRGGTGRLEWNVGMEYTDLDFDDDEGGFDARDTMFNACFRYRFTRTFALGLDIAGNGDDETSAKVAFRWNFADRN